METLVRLHRIVPSFCLPDRYGRHISLWDYKQRQPVVVVFCTAPCEGVLASFAERYPDYQRAGAEVLVIMPRAPSSPEQWPFPVLIDDESQTSARYVGQVPAIFVLDSYNSLQERVDGPWPDGIDHRHLLSTIWEFELQCPECGAPVWSEA